MILFLATTGRLGNQLFHLSALDRMCNDRQRGFLFGSESILEWFDWRRTNITISHRRPVRLIHVLRKLADLRLASHGEEATLDGEHGAVLSGELRWRRRSLVPLSLVENAFLQSDAWVRSDFSKVLVFRETISAAVDQWAAQAGINWEGTIFAHVRRGDYVEGGGALPARYYLDGLNRLRQKMKVAQVVFVTDDVSYVDQTFSEVPGKVVVSRTPGFDLCVMSKCASGVLSASSFSWWGVMLGSVIVPPVVPRYWLGWRSKFDFPARIVSSRFDPIEVEQ